MTPSPTCTREPRKERGAEPSTTPRGVVPAGSALPCLFSNNSNGTRPQLSTGAKKTAFALAANVQAMGALHGIDHLLFLTLTFADQVTDIREAQRRFNSLATGVLRERYEAFLCVVERHKSQAIHFHLVVAVEWETGRESYDWDAIASRDYRSANPALRMEWAFWRETSARYAFGRTEAQPVRSTAEGIARYVGKYIGKHLEGRTVEDKGVRLVRYSEGARMTSNRFAWHNVNSRLWRARLARFARSHGVHDLDGMRDMFGPRWAYRLKDAIFSTVLPDDGTTPADLISAQRIEYLDRVTALAHAMQESPRDIWDRICPQIENPFGVLTVAA